MSARTIEAEIVAELGHRLTKADRARLRRMIAQREKAVLDAVMAAQRKACRKMLSVLSRARRAHIAALAARGAS